MHAPVVDSAARLRISESGLGETLFVEAGAGTGKTTQLVSRVANLVLKQGVPLANIAAITFTEAAAAELRTRIRVEFEKIADDPARPAGDVALARAAIADADLAAISTVHGFASRILNQFAVAAELPPRVSVLDEVSSELEHEDRWARFIDRLHADPQHEELLYRAALMSIPLRPEYAGNASFREVAANFNQNWDRVLELADEPLPPLRPVDFSPFDDAVAALEGVLDQCTDPDDLVYRRIVDELLPEMQVIVDCVDPHRKLRLLADSTKAKWGPGRGGKAGAWSMPVAEVKTVVKEPLASVSVFLQQASEDVLAQLIRLTATEVVAGARARQAAGTLEYHDLLVLARSMLRSRPEVREALHQRFQHVLLDEFQDTDPIQIELASLIAATPADVQDADWRNHQIADGRLFFVGDPKQSIYRFRRADIRLFLQARDRYSSGGAPVELVANFRTVEPIIDWVNAVFTEAMPDEIDGAQPRCSPLVATRPPSGADHRPVVFGKGHEAHDGQKVAASHLRRFEADDVGQIIEEIADRPMEYPVWDRGTDSWRPATLRDITILLPTRTSLPFLREALNERAIPYRLATGTLVYSTQEVRDLLAAIRAIADPNDTLALVQVLRSPLYGCSDVDLFVYHQAQRRWDLRAEPPSSLAEDHPVVVALRHLHGLWKERWWLGPAALIDRVLNERRAFLLAYGESRPNEVWRRFRFILDQARAFEEVRGTDLRAFIAYAELQSADGARVHEPLLPETDDDSVQILTIHGSKGLEFPITILSGMTTVDGGTRPGVSVLWNDDDQPEVKLKKDLATNEHTARADLEAEMGAFEKLRLLYVAATRARDHLFVSGHHKAGTAAGKSFAARLSQHHQAQGDDPLALSRSWAAVDHGVGSDPSTTPEPVPDAPTTEQAFDERATWSTRRQQLLADAGQTVTMSATALARLVDPSLTDHDTDAGPDSPSEVTGEHDAGAESTGGARPIVRRKGRAGSSIGRAVHAVLQFTDFDASATDPGIAGQIDRQCELEAIVEHRETVASLVAAILTSKAIDLARRHPHYKELYVAAPVSAQTDEGAAATVTVEGYVDLLIETPDGLVIVDYKTDAASTPAEIDKKMEAYALQGAAYALALEHSTGQTVSDCIFVFAKKSGPVERPIADLDGAKNLVRRALSSTD